MMQFFANEKNINAAEEKIDNAEKNQGEQDFSAGKDHRKSIFGFHEFIDDPGLPADFCCDPSQLACKQSPR